MNAGDRKELLKSFATIRLRETHHNYSPIGSIRVGGTIGFNMLSIKLDDTEEFYEALRNIGEW